MKIESTMDLAKLAALMGSSVTEPQAAALRHQLVSRANNYGDTLNVPLELFAACVADAARQAAYLVPVPMSLPWQYETMANQAIIVDPNGCTIVQLSALRNSIAASELEKHVAYMTNAANLQPKLIEALHKIATAPYGTVGAPADPKDMARAVLLAAGFEL